LRLIAGCVPYAGSYVERADFKQWLELFPVPAQPPQQRGGRQVQPGGNR